MEEELEKNNQKRENTYPKIYSIHSQKGGVGKTSIALAIAGFEAVFNGKKVLLIDADLTGTSIKEVIDRKGNSEGKGQHKYVYINGLLLAVPNEFVFWGQLNFLISEKTEREKSVIKIKMETS